MHIWPCACRNELSITNWYVLPQGFHGEGGVSMMGVEFYPPPLRRGAPVVITLPNQ